MPYFSISSKEPDRLKILVTPDVRDLLMEQFDKVIPLELLQADKSIVEHVSMDGGYYGCLYQYIIPVKDDLIDNIFDSCKTFLRKRISNSIVNSDN